MRCYAPQSAARSAARCRSDPAWSPRPCCSVRSAEGCAVLRRVEPEWLDQLSADDPRAQGSRRDLRRVNTWMRQTAIMAALLRRHGPQHRPRRLLEIGAGDGTFMLRVARAVAPVLPGITVT